MTEEEKRMLQATSRTTAQPVPFMQSSMQRTIQSPTQNATSRPIESGGSIMPVTSPALHKSENKQKDTTATDNTGQATEQSGEQTEVLSESGATLGSRTSDGTVLNYDPSADEAYQNAIAALLEVQNNAPVYTDSYGSDLSALYERIVNRSPFRYDINGDPLYQQYRDEYLKAGQLSMMDTMGQAAGLTGGYGSTYSERAGQQAYDAYLQQLNSIIPQLYDAAYGRWSNEGDELYRQYGLLGDRRDDEYGRYEDDYSRWMQQVQLAQNAADTAYERGLGDWQREYNATMDKANMLAGTGDFSVYADLYGQDAADNLFKTWKVENPMLAYQFGYLTPQEYYGITGSYPPGYAAPSSGGGGRRGGGSGGSSTGDGGSSTGDGGSTLYPNQPSAVYDSANQLIQAGYSARDVITMVENAAGAGAITPNAATMVTNRLREENPAEFTNYYGGKH